MRRGVRLGSLEWERASDRSGTSADRLEPTRIRSSGNQRSCLGHVLGPPDRGYEAERTAAGAAEVSAPSVFGYPSP